MKDSVLSRNLYRYVQVSGKIRLFHGSKKGICGKIRPISRSFCDFGAGFYMGTNPDQVRGLVSSFPSPFFYELELDADKVGRDNILILDGMDWVYAVLACRGTVADFNELEVSKKILKKLNSVDLVIGPIADDRMMAAMRRFEANGLTDEGLRRCLLAVDYGFQYAAKTQKCCDAIEIISRKGLTPAQLIDFNKYAENQRQKSCGIVEHVARECLRQGQYLSEMIDSLKRNEISCDENMSY